MLRVHDQPLEAPLQEVVHGRQETPVDSIATWVQPAAVNQSANCRSSRVAEIEETLREPEVRALRGLTDPQIEGFILALTGIAQAVAGRYALRPHRGAGAHLTSRVPSD